MRASCKLPVKGTTAVVHNASSSKLDKAEEGRKVGVAVLKGEAEQGVVEVAVEEVGCFSSCAQKMLGACSIQRASNYPTIFVFETEFIVN